MESIGVKDQCSIMNHINNVARGILDKRSNVSEACEKAVFSDIYYQVLREAGAYSIDLIQPDYLFSIHEMLDCYQLPKVIEMELEK